MVWVLFDNSYEILIVECYCAYYPTTTYECLIILSLTISIDVLPYLPYQALICGALPVVVGNGYEVDRTFEFEGSVPPLVFANDYPTG